MSDYQTDKIMTLVRRLTQLTKAKQIKWSETDKTDSYLFSSRSSSVVVGTRDSDGNHPVWLNILDSEGEIVDSLRTQIDTGVWPDWYDDMLELHQVARRNATNADAVIDTLLAELPTDDPW